MPDEKAEAVSAPLPDTMEDKFDLLEGFIRGTGLIMNRHDIYVFVHFDVEAAEKFVSRLIKTIGEISGAMISAAEEIHPTLAGKIMRELLEKSKMIELFKELNLKIYRVFLVMPKKKAKKMPKMELVGDYVYGFPGSIDEISSYLKEAAKGEEIEKTIAGKIAKASIAYLLLKAQEYSYEGYAASEIPVVLMIWTKKPDRAMIERLESSVIENI